MTASVDFVDGMDVTNVEGARVVVVVVVVGFLVVNFARICSFVSFDCFEGDGGT